MKRAIYITAVSLLLAAPAFAQREESATRDQMMRDRNIAGEMQQGVTAPRSAAVKDADDAEEIQKTLRRSTEVFKRIRSSVPEPIVNNAHCVAIVPDVVKAAVVVGGRHGDGVALCRTSDGNWGQPMFVDLTGGSLGLQVGGTSTDYVLFFMDESAREELSEGEFELGSDAQVVSGPTELASYESNFDGVYAYRTSAGAFIGASFTGVNISPDNEVNKELYGDDVRIASILAGQTNVKSADIDALMAQLPEQGTAARG